MKTQMNPRTYQDEVINEEAKPVTKEAVDYWMGKGTANESPRGEMGLPEKPEMPIQEDAGDEFPLIIDQKGESVVRGSVTINTKSGIMITLHDASKNGGVVALVIPEKQQGSFKKYLQRKINDMK